MRLLNAGTCGKVERKEIGHTHWANTVVLWDRKNHVSPCWSLCVDRLFTQRPPPMGTQNVPLENDRVSDLLFLVPPLDSFTCSKVRPIREPVQFGCRFWDTSASEAVRMDTAVLVLCRSPGLLYEIWSRRRSGHLFATNPKQFDCLVPPCSSAFHCARSFSTRTSRDRKYCATELEAKISKHAHLNSHCGPLLWASVMTFAAIFVLASPKV